jgi:dihydrodipicolinate synthase/N-acetylneuraminate lyase
MYKFKGLTLSIPLFFDSQENINYKALDHYFERLKNIKYISAVYSMAYNTRYRMLDLHELLEVNIYIIEQAKRLSIPCFVGHPYSFTKSNLGLYLSEIARHTPSGISMLYPERYFGLNSSILDFLNFPKKYDLKVVIHEMKLVSGFNGDLINWPKDLIMKAMELDHVVAIKEDSKDDDITSYVLEECLNHNVDCILAGGGKRRALKFLNQGLNTWLNGTTMFLPELIDKIYPAMVENNYKILDYYLKNIETLFFDIAEKKVGWHLAHKAALQYFGFSDRWERFPHSYLPDEQYKSLLPTFQEIEKNASKFLHVY